MTRLTQMAVCVRRGCLAAAMLAAASPLFAESDGAARYVMAPGDPTMAPADPREAGEPRDMTSPRMTRRAMRGRSRDRIAPDVPSPSQGLRDMTASPARPGVGRRLESLWRNEPTEDWLIPNRRETARTAPPAPVIRPVAPEAPVPSSVTEPPPLAVVEAELAESPLEPARPPIRLTQANADTHEPLVDSPTVTPTPTAPAAPLAAAAAQVRSLDKPIRQIGLVEAVDIEGLRPVDVAAELSPDVPPRLLSGTAFGVAHPSRYLYCFTCNPLYFEDANLERCGIGHGICQPACSAAQFIGRTALLPYSLIAHPPCSCETTLGDCPTCHAYPWGTEVHR